MKKLYTVFTFVLVLFFVKTNMALSQVLPNYELSISQVSLDSMNAHPFDETYFPATFTYNAMSYPVQARYKGSTTLLFPKKSWAIKFENNNNPFNKDRINLHADYNDDSGMRNFLILRLFQYLGIPAPTIEHVTYQVNGQNYGVYTQTEQIDESFLIRNGRTQLSLYKGNNHGASLAPLVNDSLYSSVWSIEGGGDFTYNELRVLFNKFLYMNKTEFDSQMDNLVETDNMLSIYAVLFTFTELDNFTKNTWINKNSNSLKYELIPWDNEGSFGNSAFGDFDPSLVNYNFNAYETPEYQLVLQRMLENPIYKASFENKVNKILTDGYVFLDSLIDSTYIKIKDAVYIDPNKRETNATFDAEKDRLKWFMSERKLFLQNNSLPERYAPTNLLCDNPLPTASNPLMQIRVNSPVAQSVRLVFADSVNYKDMGQAYKIKTIILYDDGLHGDSLSNDLVYGNVIDASLFTSDLLHFTVLGGGQNFPANAIFYLSYIRTKALAINKGNVNNQVAQQIKIDTVYAYGNNRFVKIINLSTDTLDLSYCHLRTSVATNDFMFPEKTKIKPLDTIIIAASPEMGKTFFVGKKICYNLYFPINVNDSLILLSPLLTKMKGIKVNQLETLNATSFNVIFNEINYNSTITHDTKDWVEIYNAGNTSVDLSAWIFRDSDNSHAFVLNNGLFLSPNEYLVLTEDSLAFHGFNPTVNNIIGNFSFGLSGSGEYIRLYDNIGNLVDSVNYDDNLPWATAGDGNGSTLELVAPNLDNTLAENWYANSLFFGSPGKVNNGAEISALENTSIAESRLYPNPTRGFVYFDTQANYSKLELYNMNGILLNSIEFTVPCKNEEAFNLGSLPSGLYFIRVSESEKVLVHKIIFIK